MFLSNCIPYTDSYNHHHSQGTELVHHYKDSPSCYTFIVAHPFLWVNLHEWDSVGIIIQRRACLKELCSIFLDPSALYVMSYTKFSCFSILASLACLKLNGCEIWKYVGSKFKDLFCLHLSCSMGSTLTALPVLLHLLPKKACVIYFLSFHRQRSLLQVLTICQESPV